MGFPIYFLFTAVGSAAFTAAGALVLVMGITRSLDLGAVSACIDKNENNW
jgi:hypothetical protein